MHGGFVPREWQAAKGLFLLKPLHALLRYFKTLIADLARNQIQGYCSGVGLSILQFGRNMQTST